MFEALSWRKPPPTEVAIRYAADSLAHAKTPLVLGSLIAVALLGIVARIGINRAWFNHGWFNRGWLDRARMSLNGSGLRRSRATVIPARARATVGKAMPANGRRRRKRRRKAATHA